MRIEETCGQTGRDCCSSLFLPKFSTCINSDHKCQNYLVNVEFHRCYCIQSNKKLQQFWRKFHLLSFNYRHAGYDFVNFFKPRTLINFENKQSSTYTYQPCWVLPKVDRYYPRYYLRKCRRKQLGPWSGGATQCQGRKGTVLSREFRRPCSQSEGEFVSDEGFLVLAR